MTIIRINLRNNNIDILPSKEYVEKVKKQINKKFDLDLEDKVSICSFVGSRLYDAKIYLDILKLFTVNDELTYKQICDLLGKPRTTVVDATDKLEFYMLLRKESKVMDGMRKKVIKPAVDLKKESEFMKEKLDNWKEYKKEYKKRYKEVKRFEEEYAGEHRKV